MRKATPFYSWILLGWLSPICIGMGISMGSLLRGRLPIAQGIAAFALAFSALYVCVWVMWDNLEEG